ncbi:MOSC N-terminal beta barrel domain [Geosmithia morbida]|uniref:MOSC N-terminal beta barrel domain n=1 Tax=Geosmithia morbida TaxID=1094350 RepID=A0A9P5D3V9_9HYPO|nr:MOSC N-terminal beta barrel domain [Geosmithia morbida]KAF4126648.1 MOSC N-terminal beta barrel domain [Geosmithia morbida]
MKVTALWVYPIKGLRGIPLETADLGPQGLRHDRVFTVCRVDGDGDDAQLRHMQLSRFPQCSLFHQDMTDDGSHIRVRYQQPRLDPPPSSSSSPPSTSGSPAAARPPAHRPEHDQTLHVPLEPDTTRLERAVVNIHQSVVSAYRVGKRYDDWFSACFGFPVALLYIGDQRRPVLGSMAPSNPSAADRHAAASNSSSGGGGGGGGWLSSIVTSLVGGDKTGATGAGGAKEPEWLRFSDCAPYLVTTEASLADVSARMARGQQDVDMVKFRPNIVVDGDSPFDEDYWAELSVRGRPALSMSKMCGRCTSLNVDYDAGRPALGEQGTLLKKLMPDRRVDPGAAYTPVFGRYAFLSDQLASDTLLLRRSEGETPGSDAGDGDAAGDLRISVGDSVAVTRRNDARPVWDWPLKDPSSARFYSYSHPPTAQTA